jgi:hypothetical protein
MTYSVLLWELLGWFCLASPWKSSNEEKKEREKPEIRTNRGERGEA